MKAVVFQEPYKVTVEQMPDPKIEAPNDAIVRITTRIGCAGVFLAADPGGKDEQAQQGIYPFPLGLYFGKGLTIGMGQANVKKYNRYLRDLIVAGRAILSQIVSHELPLEGAMPTTSSTSASTVTSR